MHALRLAPHLALALALTACPGDKGDDGSGGSSGSGGGSTSAATTATATASSSGTSGSGSGSTSTSSTTTAATTSGTGTSGGDACPEGTCRLVDGGACEAPGGPLGNGCCACGDDGICSSFCRCAAPSTPIATPEGERPIDALAVGDLVYSLDGDRLVVVPIAATHRAPVQDHHVTELHLVDGRTIVMSPGHPTADGRTFGDLAAGDLLGGHPIARAARVPFAEAATVDILPASPSGVYFAAGVPVGSTLHLARSAHLGQSLTIAPACE